MPIRLMLNKITVNNAASQPTPFPDSNHADSGHSNTIPYHAIRQDY